MWSPEPHGRVCRFPNPFCLTLQVLQCVPHPDRGFKYLVPGVAFRAVRAVGNALALEGSQFIRSALTHRFPFSIVIKLVHQLPLVLGEYYFFPRCIDICVSWVPLADLEAKKKTHPFPPNFFYSKSHRFASVCPPLLFGHFMHFPR